MTLSAAYRAARAAVGLNGSKVGSTREFYNDPIARLGAAILQIAREILDELNTKSAGLNLLQRLVDRQWYVPRAPGCAGSRQSALFSTDGVFLLDSAGCSVLILRVEMNRKKTSLGATVFPQKTIRRRPGLRT